MSRSLLAGLAAALALALWTGIAQAAAPANDNFSASTPLGVGQEIAGSNLEATAEPGEPASSVTFKKRLKP